MIAALIAATALVTALAGSSAVAEATPDVDATVTLGDAVEPPTLEVAAGTTVTWHNADDRRHRVRTTSGPGRVDSGNLAPGERFSHTFDLAGTYRTVDHRDEDDPAYHGTIVVVARPGPPAADDGPTTSPPAEAAAVTIAERSFEPAAVTVPVGGTVTWANGSDDEHTVTADDGRFDSGLLGPGGDFAQRFDSPGTHRYVCLLHEEMRGTVEVVDTAGGNAPPSPDPAASAATAGAAPDAGDGSDVSPSTPLMVAAAAVGAAVLLGAAVVGRRRRAAALQEET